LTPLLLLALFDSTRLRILPIDLSGLSAAK
jgi:hypothetical protein